MKSKDSNNNDKSYKSKYNRTSLERCEKPGFIIGMVLSAFFILMQVMSGIACLTVQTSNQGKLYGIIMLVAAGAMVVSMLLLAFKKRFVSFIFALGGWIAGLMIGVNLTNPAIVEANRELPTQKFMLCHVLPVFIFLFALTCFVYNKVKQKKQDHEFFIKTTKDNNKYNSIID